ncbi:MAG: hypothetical protein ABI823_21195 [Bryobacteraceae bacterium]
MTDHLSDNEDSFAALEERIVRAVEVVNELRSEKQDLLRQIEAANAERDAARQAAGTALERAQKMVDEMDHLRTERKQVRTRIEKLLGQMDLLSGA